MGLKDNVCLGHTYDILAIFISIADVTTDIWITYEYYMLGHRVFFGISLFIICMAQLSYCITFALRCMKQFGGLSEFMCCCCAAIPFAPVISLILYLFHHPKTFCSRLLRFTIIGETFNLTDDDILKFVDSEQSEFNQFLMKKLSAHIGFILEAFVEAFPQSLLQMVAIVYYNRADWVSILSILLSMLSVTTKSFVFSKGINLTQFIFTWFCVCTDFFGIFFAIAWAFNRPVSMENELTIIGHIYIYKVLCGSVPIALFICVFMYFYAAPKWFEKVSEHGCNICTCTFSLFMSIFGLIVGCSVLCLLSEIFNFTLIALFIYYFGTTRFSKYDQVIENKILNKTIDFIRDGRSNHDKALRVFAINAQYYISFATMDKKRKLERYKFSAYIDTIEENEALELVTWKNMRLNAMNEEQQNYANFWNHILLKTMFQQLKDELGVVSNGNHTFIGYIGYVGLYFLFPLYLMSKVIMLLFP
eukprot:350276_1